MNQPPEIDRDPHKQSSDEFLASLAPYQQTETERHSEEAGIDFSKPYFERFATANASWWIGIVLFAIGIAAARWIFTG